jgi:hypothetical protein
MKKFLLTFTIALLFLAPLVSKPTNANNINPQSCNGSFEYAHSYATSPEEALANACIIAYNNCLMYGAPGDCQETSSGCCHGGLYFSFVRLCCTPPPDIKQAVIEDLRQHIKTH